MALLIVAMRRSSAIARDAYACALAFGQCPVLDAFCRVIDASGARFQSAELALNHPSQTMMMDNGCTGPGWLKRDEQPVDLRHTQDNRYRRECQTMKTHVSGERSRTSWRRTSRLVLVAMFAGFASHGWAQAIEAQAAKAPPSNAQLASPEIEKRVDALLGQMTLEEKLGQLVQYNTVGTTFCNGVSGTRG